MKKTFLCTALVSLLVIALAPVAMSARSHDGPPSVYLRAHHRRIQQAAQVADCWKPRGSKQAVCGTGIGFPHEKDAQAGRFRFRIHRGERPTKVKIRAWRRTYNGGVGKGKAERIAYHMARFHGSSGNAGWDAIFQLSADRPYYLEIRLDYKEGYGIYHSHVHT